MSHYAGQPGYPPTQGYPPPQGGYPPVGQYPPDAQGGYPGAYPPAQGYPGSAPPPAFTAPQAYPGATATPPAFTAPQGYPGAPGQGVPQGYPGHGTPQGYPGAAPVPQQGYPGAAHGPQQGYAAAHGHAGAPGAVGSGLPPPVPHGVTMGAVPKGTLVDQKYVTPTEITLVLKEHVDPRMHAARKDSDNFTVYDSHGRVWFRQNAHMMSMLDQRQILDSSGQPCVSIMKKPMSFHGGWLMYRGAGFGNEAARICEVQPKKTTVSPYCRVFLNDGDKNEDYSCSGNFMAKKFDIMKKQSGKDVLWAHVKKESTFANPTAFLNSQAGAQSYFITVKPGADVAFVVALACLLDEIYRDNNGP